jgi:hypothetical protein
MALTPALKRVVAITTHGEDAHALGAIKEVLACNELYGCGVVHQAADPAPGRVTMPVNALLPRNLTSARVPIVSPSNAGLQRSFRMRG